MKNSYRFIFLSFILLVLKCAFVAATDDDDDESLEVLTDIFVGIIGVFIGACSENPTCSTTVLPVIILVAFILCVCSWLFSNEEDNYNHRIRLRTAGSGFVGYTTGRLIAKNW
jgi:hypothetical protein